jgi:prepilin-type N-terminal cleavage/methylation domain-containing protein/prepilin-type processing-associated H-X9-DG protein
MRRSRAFTLIELLVVIAIIGILAAMLFPVFARARESARKIQCLSNVKNIAMAIQMYMGDYQALWPGEHRAEAIDFFDTMPGQGGGGYEPDCRRVETANPYLREAVILDEYIKNRDIWRCPSAKTESGAQVMPGASDHGGTAMAGGWLNFWVTNLGNYGLGKPMPPCNGTFPQGWGGDITDSLVQAGVQGAGNMGFVASLQTTPRRDLRESSIDQPSDYPPVADSGGGFMAPNIAYPDICRIACMPTSSSASCGYTYPDGCGNNAAGCYPDLGSSTDPSKAAKYTRHLGGSNVGFMDGHAQWFSARAFLAEAPRWSGGCPKWGSGCPIHKVEGKWKGLPFGGWPTSDAGAHDYPTTAAGGDSSGNAPGSSPSINGCGEIPLY